MDNVPDEVFGGDKKEKMFRKRLLENEKSFFCGCEPIRPIHKRPIRSRKPAGAICYQD